MLWGLAILFLVLWGLGLLTSYTLGGFVHIPSCWRWSSW